MMRKCRMTAILLVLVLLTMTACAQGNAKTAAPGLLEYPGLHWNDSPETVRTALGLTDEQILFDGQEGSGEEDAYDVWTLAATDVECFGVQAVQALFTFSRPGGKEYGLESVRIYYPHDTDMTTVEKAMSDLYGSSTTRQPVSYTFRDGALEEDSSENLELANGATSPADALRAYWTSDVNGKDFLSEQGQQKMVDYLTGLQTQSISEGTAREWLEKNPLATAYCTDASMEAALTGATQANITANSVYLEARQLVYLQQNFS